MASVFRVRGNRGRNQGYFKRGGLERLEDRTMLSGTPPTVVDLQVSSTQWTNAFESYLAANDLGDLGFRIPAASSTQPLSLPWVNVDQVIITFSEDVNVKSADLSITGIDAPSIAFSDFHYDPLERTAVWTLASPLTKNAYHLDLNGDGNDPVSDLEGNVLNGAWTNNAGAFAYGVGGSGGDFSFRFNVLPGDVEGTGVVTGNDLNAATSSVNYSTTAESFSARADIDGSGVIDAADAQSIQARMGSMQASGVPVGVNDDAPSSSGRAYVMLDNTTSNFAISLWDLFEDAESGDEGMTYQILSNSNASLFDYVLFESGSGELLFNAATGASGRSELVVQATDSSGQTTLATLVADVFYENQPPVLDWLAISQGAYTWIISGSVYDPDDDVSEMIVQFGGVFDIRCAVMEDGTFEFAVIVDTGHWGMESAYVLDPHDQASNFVMRVIGVT